MRIQGTLDKAAIGLSLLCAVHCLVLPVTMVFAAISLPIGLDNEAFHRWILVGIVPVSVLALLMGCRRHKQASVYALGAAGLVTLLVASFFGHNLLGEPGEKALTLIGGAVLILGHIQNYRLCSKSDCGCVSEDKSKS